MDNARQVPVILMVDVEPDLRDFHISNKSHWSGFEWLIGYVKEQRPQFEEATGSPVHFSWFLRMDPQIEQGYGDAAWAAFRYEREFRDLLDCGDEIGLHVHGYAWDTARERWVARHDNQGWVDECCRVGFEAYERAFGKKPVSFRFGNQWLNHATLRTVERMGAKIDLTVEPGRQGHLFDYGGDIMTGKLPDYRGFPRMPYCPSLEDWKRHDPDREGIWEIPLTAFHLDYRYGRAERLWRRIVKPESLRKELTMNLAIGPRNFAELTEKALAFPFPYLCMVMRSDLPISAEQRHSLKTNINYVLASSCKGERRIVGPDSFMVMHRDFLEHQVDGKWSVKKHVA